MKFTPQRTANILVQSIIVEVDHLRTSQESNKQESSIKILYLPSAARNNGNNLYRAVSMKNIQARDYSGLGPNEIFTKHAL